MSANVNRNLNKSSLAVNKSTDFYEEEHRLNKIIKKNFSNFNDKTRLEKKRFNN